MDILNTLLNNENLSSDQTHALYKNMAGGAYTQSQIGAILVALRLKGETPDEIYGLIQAMREEMIQVIAAGAVDTCGTGGDNKGTFNISTAVSFVVAGAGIPVVKHGNRSASSSCGSADVLEELGVKISLSSSQAEETFRNIGIVFLFAPVYHPSIKNVVLVRKELGVRTIFNYLGPFVNPAGVRRQIIGVPEISQAEKLAQVALKLSYDHLLIVSGVNGMDELSVSAKNSIFEIKDNKISHRISSPKDFGFAYESELDLKGGNVKENAKIVSQLLRGERGIRRDTVLLNSAYALYVSGKVQDPKDGLVLAQQSIDSGAAAQKLEQLIALSNKYE